MAKVNLDAMVPREDFETEENPNPGKKKETLSIEDLKPDSFFFTNLKKPDFQRETNEWDSKKILEFILSFLNGDLIPAIILWRSSSGYLFVIDGSHRLSALASWINDDYGDGYKSKIFYDGIISEEQNNTAEETRKLLKKHVGSYEDYKLALTHPDKVSEEIVKRAKNLAALAVQLQWVEGDSSKAENSFFKINQQAAPIDKTELRLLETRRMPDSIAARAIIRSGKGHKYWSLFDKEKQDEIQELAKEINDILFTPNLKTPVKTLDIPIGGKISSAQALPLILDFINIVNLESIKKKKKAVGDDGSGVGNEDDKDGKSTIQYLKNVRTIARLINSNHPSSLGLHPSVYFYSLDGRHKITSFYSTVDFVIQLKNTNKINNFIRVRSLFEELIQKYDYLIQQVNRKYRSSWNSYKPMSSFYLKAIELLEKNPDIDDVIKKMIEGEFSYLTLSVPEVFETTQQDFTTSKKSAVFIKEALGKVPKCKICNGLIHRNSISIDHIKRKQDGGVADIENGQLTHPYCNTGYKN